MKRINWHLEEAVALFELYLKYQNYQKINKNDMLVLSDILKYRAKLLKFDIPEKFRNLDGISQQLGNIHYVVTGGKEGLPNASSIFYETFELYNKFPHIFARILKEFYEKYNL